jgi:AraC family transcriptional regulator
MSNHFTIYIKNMVCPRCKTAVASIMEANQLKVVDIQLGEVEVLADENLNLEALNANLKTQGFEIIFDREHQLTEQIKTLLLDYLAKIEFIHVKLSDYLATKMELNYPYLSKVFSKNEHETIERYFILLKIEKIKELISYNQLSMSEIAYQLGYSSPQALSSQFKSITGKTVSEFKEMGHKNRSSLDKLY